MYRRFPNLPYRRFPNLRRARTIPAARLDGLQRALGPKGYEILAAASLEAGLALALAHLPDLIIGQTAPGRLEGGLLQRRLGEWGAAAPIPVILIADASAQVTLREVLKAGDELLIEPVSAEMLIQVLEAYPRKKELPRPASAEPPAAAQASERDSLWALMDPVPDQIYFKDTASQFTRINRQQARILGLADPEAAIGKSDHDFFDQASSPSHCPTSPKSKSPDRPEHQNDR